MLKSGLPINSILIDLGDKLLVSNTCLLMDEFRREEAAWGLGIRILNTGLFMDPFRVDLDDRLKVLEIGLWIGFVKIEEARGNLLLFKPRLLH